MACTVPRWGGANLALALPGLPVPGFRGLWLTGRGARTMMVMSTTETKTKSKTDNKPLCGRVAVVTGATSGIGAATAARLAADGAAVALVGRRADRLEALAAQLDSDGGVIPVALDVADVDAVARAGEEVRAQLGRVDLVVANAGQMLAGPFEEQDVDEWDRMLDVNVRGLLRVGRAFADDLIAAAAEGLPADLVHVGSVGGHEKFPNYGVYCATKAAGAHLTRNLRAELGPRGVRVKCVEPGFVATELADHMVHPAGRASLEQFSGLEPLQPDDLAEAIAWSVAAPPRVNVAELIVVPTAQG
jgi:NADP-dependent 3-hydroxy acid dehydrogenase YdfG